MPHTTLSISLSLIVGGAALVTLGGLRMLRAGFGAMPKPVAAMVTLIGLLVVIFGVALPRIGRPQAPPDTSFRLRPQPTGATNEAMPATKIRGVVEDADENPVAGVSVSLAGGSNGEPITVRTDADGTFLYDEVTIGGPYVVRATFDDGVFPAPPFFAPLSKPITIRVTQTTKSDSKLSIRASSLALVGAEEGIEAVQALTVVNSGDAAFVGGLRLPVLAGASSLAPGLGLMRDQLASAGGSLFSNVPVMPGDTQITYTYSLETPARGVAFEHETALRTERFDLLAGGDLKPRSPRPDAQQGRVTLGGRPYARLSWRSLGAGRTIAAHLDVAAPPSALRIASIAAAVLAALVFVLLPLFRRKRPQPAPEQT